MPKNKSKPELYLLLDAGLTPKNLIERGYSKATVYAYNKRYKIAKEKTKKLLTKK